MNCNAHLEGLLFLTSQHIYCKLFVKPAHLLICTDFDQIAMRRKAPQINQLAHMLQALTW